MGREATFTEEEKSRIKELVDKNYPPYMIAKILKEEMLGNHDKDTIKEFIGRKEDEGGLNKEWNKPSKSWIIKDSNAHMQAKSGSPQPEFSVDEDQRLTLEANVPLAEFKEKATIHSGLESLNPIPEPLPDTQVDNHPLSQITSSPLPPSSNDINQILELCSLMKLEIAQLYSEIKSVQNKVEDLKDKLIESKQKTTDEICSLASDFIAIYASEKSKKSISINSKIMEKVAEMMKDKPYNIDSNDSLAINTALLLALYKSVKS